MNLRKPIFSLVLPLIGVPVYLLIAFIMLSDSKNCIDEMDRAVLGLSFFILICTALFGFLLTWPFHDLLIDINPYFMVGIISFLNFVLIGVLIDFTRVIIASKTEKQETNFNKLRDAMKENP